MNHWDERHTCSRKTVRKKTSVLVAWIAVPARRASDVLDGGVPRLDLAGRGAATKARKTGEEQGPLAAPLAPRRPEE